MYRDETWQALRALSLVALALFIGGQAPAAQRPQRWQKLGAALVVYLAGGAVIAEWYLMK
jgi:hypothetical protein